MSNSLLFNFLSHDSSHNLLLLKLFIINSLLFTSLLTILKLKSEKILLKLLEKKLLLLLHDEFKNFSFFYYR